MLFLLFFVLENFCHNLVGSLHQNPKLGMRKEKTIKIEDMKYKTVQIVHCAEA